MTGLGSIPASPIPDSGTLHPEIIKTDDISGIRLLDVLRGADQLLPEAIPIQAPLYDAGAFIGLNIASPFTISGGKLRFNSSGISPSLHAGTHAFGGLDAININSYGPFSPKTASSTQLGGVKVPTTGSGLSLSSGNLSVNVSAGAGALVVGGNVLSVNPGTGLYIAGTRLHVNLPSPAGIGGIRTSPAVGITSSSLGHLVLTGLSPGTPMPGSKIVFSNTSPKGFYLPSSFTYTKDVSPDQLPFATTSDPGAIIIGDGLAFDGTTLSLPITISPVFLPRATGASYGIVAVSPKSGLEIVGSGNLQVNTSGSTLTLDSTGIRVTDQLFVPLAGTGLSPNASPSGWIRGTLKFEDDVGVAINIGNSRIVAGSALSPSLASATSLSLLTKAEVESLISAASFGLVVSYAEPVKTPPSSSFPTSLTVGDRYVTSISPAASAPGIWSTRPATFAEYSEIAPETYGWVYTSPLVSTLFYVESTGDIWAFEVPSSPKTRNAHKVITNTLATATSSTTGGVKVDSSGGLEMSGSVLRVRTAGTTGASTGLNLVSSSEGRLIGLNLDRTGALEINPDNQLTVKSASISSEHLVDDSVRLTKLRADLVPDGTKDFIETAYDGLSVRVAGDNEDFRVTGLAVSDVTRPIIHTDQGLSIAVESLTTESLAPEAVSVSKLFLDPASGLVEDQEAIKIKLRDLSGLTLVDAGIGILVHGDDGSGQIVVDATSGGLRLRRKSITGDYLAESFSIPASAVSLQAPLYAEDTGQLNVYISSPLGLSSDSPVKITVRLTSITESYLSNDAVAYSKLKKASVSGLGESPAGSIKVNIGSGLAFSSNTIVVSGVNTSNLALAANAPFINSSGLTLNTSNEFSLSGAKLSLNTDSINFNTLDRYKLYVSPPSSFIDFSGIIHTSPGELGISPIGQAGLKIHTFNKYDYDYFAPGGQGFSTIETLGETRLYAGDVIVSPFFNYRKLKLTPNSVGLTHLSLGNLNIEGNTNGDRLPTGFGSYKALVQSGKLSASPITLRGWSPALLSSEILAVNVGNGLTISNSGVVSVADIGIGELNLLSSPTLDVNLFTSELVQEYDNSLAIALDPGDFYINSPGGLALKPALTQKFTGVTIPAFSSPSKGYVFTLASGDTVNRLALDTVEVNINGLFLPTYYYTASSAVGKTVIVHKTVSPSATKKNLLYNLVQTTSPEFDIVTISYRLRAIV